MSSPQIPTASSLFFEHHSETIPYHKSYLLAQQDNIANMIHQLHTEHPGLPLTKVVTTILSKLPENMASRLVRELTLFIIETWEGVSIDTLEKV